MAHGSWSYMLVKLVAYLGRNLLLFHSPLCLYNWLSIYTLYNLKFHTLFPDSLVVHSSFKCVVWSEVVHYPLSISWFFVPWSRVFIVTVTGLECVGYHSHHTLWPLSIFCYSNYVGWSQFILWWLNYSQFVVDLCVLYVSLRYDEDFVCGLSADCWVCHVYCWTNEI